RPREAHIAERLGAWLADREHAEVVAQHAADVAVELADTMREEDVQDVLHEQLRRGLENVPLAPLAGKALLAATEEGRHQELLDVVLRGAGRFLDENRETLRTRFEQETPWWVPSAIDNRIFDRLLDGMCSFFDRVNTDTGHELRSRLDDWIRDVADRLQHSPEYRERGEQLKFELLDHPQLRQWLTSLWIDAKAPLRPQAADPHPPPPRRSGGHASPTPSSPPAGASAAIRRSPARLTTSSSGGSVTWGSTSTPRSLAS